MCQNGLTRYNSGSFNLHENVVGARAGNSGFGHGVRQALCGEDKGFLGGRDGGHGAVISVVLGGYVNEELLVSRSLESLVLYI